MLELRQLVKHYSTADGEVVRALDGVSTTIGAGELVALHGPSGSGKTTLLAIAAALMAPDAGAVLLDGCEVSPRPAREAARYRRVQVGWIGQAPDLLPGVSALDNAALKLFALRLGAREARRRVTPLLERLGLGDRLAHRAEQLSTGQRQRVLIARALSTGPRLVLADEPTGSLDSARGAEVLALLRELCEERGVATLLATHDPRAADYANRAHVLRDGRLLETQA